MNRRPLSSVAVLMRAEADAHAALVDATRAGVPPERRLELHREWQLAAETFINECESRSLHVPQVLAAAVAGEGGR